MVEKSKDAFRTISEVSEILDVPAHVLRFWESKFSQIKPVKRGGGRRYYRPNDISLIRGIRDLLYTEGLTIKGAQKVFRDRGIRHVINLGSQEENLWEEPAEAELDMAEPAAPPPADPLPDAPPVSSAETANELRALDDPEPEPDIRSLFDERSEPAAAPAAPADPAETIAQTAETAIDEADRTDAIRSIVGRLERLRNRMLED